MGTANKGIPINYICKGDAREQHLQYTLRMNVLKNDYVNSVPNVTENMILTSY